MLRILGFYASYTVFFVAVAAGVLAHKPWIQVLVLSVAAYFLVDLAFKAGAGIKK